mgnify:CR=1 FL=1
MLSQRVPVFSSDSRTQSKPRSALETEMRITFRGSAACALPVKSGRRRRKALAEHRVVGVGAHQERFGADGEGEAVGAHCSPSFPSRTVFPVAAESTQASATRSARRASALSGLRVSSCPIEDTRRC